VRSRKGHWHDIALDLDWCRADLERIRERSPKTSNALSTASKPVLEKMGELERSVRAIVRELDVWITWIERSVEFVMARKVAENVETLDPPQVAIEGETAWLLHRWLDTKEEVMRLGKELASVEDCLDDDVIELAMSEAFEGVVDKGAKYR
jgi:hypothetical protein